MRSPEGVEIPNPGIYLEVIPNEKLVATDAYKRLLQLAIEAAGTLDKKAVREALAKMNTMTFFGPIKFGPTGQVISLDPPVFQVQKGKQVVILPAAIKQGDLQLGVK